ncbi:MAG: HD domain-containing protein, partial [Candidatus Methanomethylophilaceae archaeon]|nr:HD domain-containing protein [Candidatus Methanomethylophilaceae archaeon]
VRDVGVEITSRSNLQSRMKIGKTDVSILDEEGKVRSLTRFSPIARALQSRDPYGWAVLVSSPEGDRETVAKAARRVLGL